MTIILAAGNQERWNENILFPEYPIKQLVKVNGKPLILDIQDKFGGVVIVSEGSPIADYCYPYYQRAMTKAERIFNMMWTGDLIVLLGDVFYSPQTVKQIETCSDTCFFGCNGVREIYASRITQDKKPEMEQLIKSGSSGNLWQIYDYLKQKRWEETQDTRDFDTQTDYANWLKRVQRIKAG